MNTYGGRNEMSWELVKSIMQSVSNREKSQYPYAKVNSDGSVSFFKEQDVKCDIDLLNADDVREYLMEQSSSKQHTIIGNGEIVKKINHQDTSLVEYKLNLTVEDFDAILKKSACYYYDRDSILSLTKNFILKEGKIMLFPVLPSEEGFVVRATGCQMVEMPTVQLLKIMQETLGGDKQIPQFHWVPQRVLDELRIEQSQINRIINSILKDCSAMPIEKRLVKNGMVDVNRINVNDDQGFERLISKPLSSAVRIVDIDEKANAFYALYGNVDSEELKYCKSLEVDTLLFLEYAKKDISEGMEIRYNKRESIKLQGAIDKIDSMMNVLTTKYVNNSPEGVVVSRLPIAPEEILLNINSLGVGESEGGAGSQMQQSVVNPPQNRENRSFLAKLCCCIPTGRSAARQ